MTKWQSGLYDCFDDWKICCYGCWCTSCLYGENAVQIDGSDYDEACWTYCGSGQNSPTWIPVTDNRRALRLKYGLAEEPCDDCSVIFYCAPCAVCQAARELKIRNNIAVSRQSTIIAVQPTNNTENMQPVKCTESTSLVRTQQT